MEKDELNDLLREVCRDEILKDARPTLTTLKALHADRPLLVLALSQAIDAITELKVATAREARLVEALERLRDCDWVISLPDRMDAVRKIAREALADIQPKY